MFPYYLLIKNKVWQLYLVGLKGIFETSKNYQYAYYRNLLLIICPLIFTKYAFSKYRPEFDYQTKPGLFPLWVYRSREDHYKFWEFSRIIRRQFATFNYYDYDESSDFMFYTSDTGIQTNEKNNFHLEKIENIENPLFEEIVKEFKTKKSRESLKRGNLLIAYEKNRNNFLSLKNYLQYKPITFGDLFRAVFQSFMINLKLTNHYRYDHFMAKNDFFYELEKLRLAMNIFDKTKDDKIAEYALIFDNLADIFK